MNVLELTNRFIRGAAFSRSEEAIFLIEANHSLYTLRAMPDTSATVYTVEGAEHIEQAQFVSIKESPPVKHLKVEDGKEIKWCTRAYDIYTSKGVVRILVESDDIADLDTLRLELMTEKGFPPEDAKRLENTSN